MFSNENTTETRVRRGRARQGIFQTAGRPAPALAPRHSSPGEGQQRHHLRGLPETVGHHLDARPADGFEEAGNIYPGYGAWRIKSAE